MSRNQRVRACPPKRARAGRTPDPITDRLLTTTLWLEAAPWPATRRAYAAQLVALAIRCERPAAKAAFYAWFIRQLNGHLPAPSARWAALRRDALHDVIATLPGVLFRLRAGLGAKRPNLRSMLWRLIAWRARDQHTAEARHGRGRVEYDVDRRLAGRDPAIAVEAAEVLALLDERRPRERALRLVGLGYSVAEAARMTGVSRQQVYRARAVLRAVVLQMAQPRDSTQGL